MSMFFALYWTMTGIHGFHVFCGMVVIAWLIVRGRKGHFHENHYMPVDLVGLYWHIVDLIWIFLFPLLYLVP
jgi:cytochrome c oxidase subunit 3